MDWIGMAWIGLHCMLSLIPCTAAFLAMSPLFPHNVRACNVAYNVLHPVAFLTCS